MIYHKYYFRQRELVCPTRIAKNCVSISPKCWRGAGRKSHSCRSGLSMLQRSSILYYCITVCVSCKTYSILIYCISRVSHIIQYSTVFGHFNLGCVYCAGEGCRYFSVWVPGTRVPCMGGERRVCIESRWGGSIRLVWVPCPMSAGLSSLFATASMVRLVFFAIAAFFTPLAFAGGIRREARCCCLQQPTGRGCGELMHGGCDAITCDGVCTSPDRCGGHDALIETATKGNSTVQSHTAAIIEEVVNVTDANSSFAAEEHANNASAYSPRSASTLSDVVVTRAPSATEMAVRRAAAKAAKRAAMLKQAEKNLVVAEEDVLKSHGVHVGDALPQNVLITILHAENAACFQNASSCEWQPLPVSWYGGDIPIATKSSFHEVLKSEMISLSCVVCDDKSRCTRPESMATHLSKGIGNPTKGTRNYLVDLSHDINMMEKRCRYKPPPFNIKLRHLRNQYEGLSGIWGKAPELEGAKLDD